MRASRDASRFRSMGLALAAQRPWGWGAQRRVCSARMRHGAALGAHIPQVDWGRLQFPFCRVMVSDGMVARDSSVEVLDVAQIMLRSVKRTS